jgi:hypothetical protein
LIWGIDFDAATATPDGSFAVLYKRLGTKALLLRDGNILRELNRSYYFAETYEYPICIWKASDGRTLIAHCPDDYCRIDIEDGETGERLTHGTRKPQDFFHSRLKVNPAGTRLLSAGWIWHPFDSLVYFDVAEALRNPAHLDGTENFPPRQGNAYMAEVGSACWQAEDRILLGGVSDPAFSEDNGKPGEAVAQLRANGLALYDAASKSYVKSFALGETPGTMMPVGDRHAVCFYGHPKLVSLDTGEILQRWAGLDTGKGASSILQDSKGAPLALDAENRRFAVSAPDGIHVIQIETNE